VLQELGIMLDSMLLVSTAVSLLKVGVYMLYVKSIVTLMSPYANFTFDR
jgi:hypothetical protein